jgi:hypothetical protein
VIRRLSRLGIFLGCLLCLAGSARPEAAAPIGPKPEDLNRPKFLLLVLDQITWNDYFASAGPSLKELREDGAVGLMVTRTAGPAGQGGFLTIGAGARLRSASLEGLPDVEGFAFYPWEKTRFGPAGEFYHWQTGENSDSAGVVHLALPALITVNADLDYLAEPGLLGETLAQNGLKTACLGNADFPGHRNRPAAAIAMDSRGQIPLGELDGHLLEKGAVPPRTSPEALLAAFDRFAPLADFLVIDYGDPERIAHESDLLSPEMAQLRRQEALTRAEKFLSGLLNRMSDKPWRLLVVTPNLKTATTSQEGRLAPIILYGDKVASGWVISPSTRSRGLVVNTDIAPTILDFFHLGAPAQMAGRPITALGENILPPTRLAALQKEIARRDTLENQKRLLTRPVMIFLMMAFVLFGVAILLGLRLPTRLSKALRFVSLALLAWPLIMALLGSWLPAQPAAGFGLMIMGSCLLALLAGWIPRNQPSPVVSLAALTGIILAADLISPGQRLMHYSPLSYFPSEGSRYYGIGNEFGGVFLAAFLIALSGLWGKKSRPARVGQGVLMLAGIGLMGAGRLGANFGMTLAAAAAFFTIVFLSFAPGSIWRKVGGIGLLAAVAALVGLELLQGGGASHLGMAAREMEQPGQRQLLGTIIRKLAMNWKLLQYSLWAEVLAFAVGLIILLTLEPKRRLGALLKSQPGLKMAFWASLVGGAGAFVFNDSGTVAAALLFSYLALWLSYLLLPKEDKSPRPTAG